MMISIYNVTQNIKTEKVCFVFVVRSHEVETFVFEVLFNLQVAYVLMMSIGWCVKFEVKTIATCSLVPCILIFSTVTQPR